MKKMISTQGLSNGDFYDENIATAIKDRVCPRLEHFFHQMSERAIYTPSGNTIVLLPNVPKYRIEEGTLFMAPTAFENCPRLRQLDIPYGMINHREVLKSAPKVRYKELTTLYDGSPPDDEVDDDDFILDEHHVAYSKDGKKLLFARIEFCEPRHEVPDGVEEITECAFCSCNTYVELSIPRSIRIIGDNIFGNGGHIEIRDELLINHLKALYYQ